MRSRLRCACRDDRPTDEGTPWGEQEQLEQAALKRTNDQRGAPDAAQAGGAEAQQKQYDFVEDDHIDFVVLETIKGNLDEESSRCQLCVCNLI